MIVSISKIFSRNGNWLEKQQKTILSAALVITVANILSSLSGLVRERLLISTYFDSPASQQAYEAFQVAFQIPDMLFQLIVLGAISASFIPVFTSYLKKNKQEAFEMSASMMNLLVLIYVGISAVVFIFAKQLTLLRTGVEFSSEQLQIATTLTRIMLVAQLFFAVSNFFTGILQSFQKFIVPAIAPVLYNLGIMLGIVVFSDRFGIYAAGVGVVIGAIIHAVVQLPFAVKAGFRFSFKTNISHPGVKKLFSLMPPRLLTIGATELQNLGMGFIATSIGDLSFAIIRLALRLMTIPIRLFGVSIGQASLPFLSEESDQIDKTRFNQLVVRSLHQVAFFALPSSMLLLILRIPIVRLIFGAHNFPWRTTVLTGQLVAIIALSITAQAMIQLLIRAFYAVKDTKTPFVVTSIAVVMYLFSSWLMVFKFNWGVTSMAYATVFAAFTEFGLFTYFLNKQLRCFLSRDFIIPQTKMVASSFFMAVSIYLPFKVLDELVFDTSRTIELIGLTVVTSTIGVLVYWYFSALFDVKEIVYFNDLFKIASKWRKSSARIKEVMVESSIEGDEI